LLYSWIDNNVQCLTIDEVIEYLENLSRRLDDVEDLRIRGRGNEVEEDDWKQSSEKASDPVDHLEDLRQIVMDYTWKDVIEANISDWLERFPYIENGEFNYKAPLAETDAGRARAYVTSLLTSLSKPYTSSTEQL
jgi:hypothetical protein